ncbi:hypothetical protein, partial [Streptomyces sp. URMC 126]|uniref:hypothetical protein n=1 Tax=Streptomyces sp. URMC 126 TaxID=3423401 RepID=UPI003F53535E
MADSREEVPRGGGAPRRVPRGWVRVGAGLFAMGMLLLVVAAQLRATTPDRIGAPPPAPPQPA